MEKCFLDSDIVAFPIYQKCTAAREMQTSFQLLVQETDTRGIDKKLLANLRFSGDLAPYTAVRSVDYIPSEMPVYGGGYDDNYLRTTPGLYPDLLLPLHHTNTVTVLNQQIHPIWVDVKCAEGLAPDDSNLTKHNPMTFVTVSKNGKKVWLVEVDGRSRQSKGMKSVEMAQTSIRLGGYDMTRFDGGGSSAMWVRDCGGLVSVPSDKKGERSCLNYILIRLRH